MKSFQDFLTEQGFTPDSLLESPEGEAKKGVQSSSGPGGGGDKEREGKFGKNKKNKKKPVAP